LLIRTYAQQKNGFDQKERSLLANYT